MDDLAKRFSELTPEKRELLQQLLARNGLQISDLKSGARREGAAEGSEARSEGPSGDIQEVMVDEAPVILPPNPSPAEIKAYHRSVYNRLNNQLNSTPYSTHIRFCNFGYLADSSPQFSQVMLPPYILNKNTIQLVLEVIGDCDLTGCAILDVGCGRGGTISVIAEYFQPKRVAGIDLSSSAIAFCRKNNPYEHVVYYEGDAENLLFQDEEFDVILNIESSHSYPAIEKFYLGVFRLLRTGGYFLYADLFPAYQWRGNVHLLQQTGFSVERDWDITHNVLLSCDQTAASKLSAYRPDNDPEFMRNYLGMPDSNVYNGMQNRTWMYKILKLGKE